MLYSCLPEVTCQNSYNPQPIGYVQFVCYCLGRPRPSFFWSCSAQTTGQENANLQSHADVEIARTLRAHTSFSDVRRKATGPDIWSATSPAQMTFRTNKLVEVEIFWSAGAELKVYSSFFLHHSRGGKLAASRNSSGKNTVYR